MIGLTSATHSLVACVLVATLECLHNAKFGGGAEYSRAAVASGRIRGRIL